MYKHISQKSGSQYYTIQIVSNSSTPHLLTVNLFARVDIKKEPLFTMEFYGSTDITLFTRKAKRADARFNDWKGYVVIDCVHNGEHESGYIWEKKYLLK